MKSEKKKKNLGVIGSFMYALMLDTGSSKGPSTKVGFSFPSYSNLLNMSWNDFACKQHGKNTKSRKIRKHRHSNRPAVIQHCLDQRLGHQMQSVLEIQASTKRMENKSVKKQ